MNEPTAGEHHPNCYQRTGVPDDLPAGLCDCQVLRMLDAATPDAGDAHHIVASRVLSHGETAYTCACGEEIRAHPDVLHEALAFHVARETPDREEARDVRL